MTKFLKNIDINIYASHGQNISPSILNIKKMHKDMRH